MRPRVIAMALLALALLGCGAVSHGAGSPGATPAVTEATRGPVAMVVHDVVAREAVRVDVFLPAAAARPPWIVFVHERGWPPPDEKERVYAGVADALQRRGIGVALVSLAANRTARKSVEVVAETLRELNLRADAWGLDARPVLAGDQRGAALVAWLALDRRFAIDPTKLRGVIAMNGVYDDAEDPEGSAIAHVRPDAPPFLILSAHGDSPRSAQSSRSFARALERAGSKAPRSYHVAARDMHSLSNLSGERNDVGELVAAFVRGEPAPGGAESAWAVTEAWGANAPLSTESFWKDDAQRIVRRPIDARFRAQLARVYGVAADDALLRELEPWPSVTYDAIDLGDYLRAHPELGTGDWVEVTNARGEKLVYRRDEIERDRPVIVVGIDDERNLFRLLVTYNVRKSYSWKPDEPPPLLARPVGAFLHVPTERAAPAGRRGPPRAVTLADFALTTTSFRVLKGDPLAPARAVPKALATTFTNEQGCLQCHAFRGVGARSHHLRASDGKPASARALAFEEYPADVLRRFLFEQESVAQTFGVNPIRIDPAAANELVGLVAR